eukprot:gene15212-biopygen16989
MGDQSARTNTQTYPQLAPNRSSGLVPPFRSSTGISHGARGVPGLYTWSNPDWYRGVGIDSFDSSSIP